MSTDMYSPSLPDLVAYFDTSPTRVKLTLSLNMLAFGFAQLIHGPLSDRFGRRPVLMFSLLAVAVLSLACGAAQNIEQLILARVLLGLVAAAEAVVGLAILKDLYSEREQIKAMALLGMVIAAAPAIAPILGGYLHVTYGWQSNFTVIAIMALVSFGFVARLLPESAEIDTGALKFARVMRGYGGLLVNAEFVVHSVILGVAMGLIFVFVTGAPFVLIVRLGVQTEHFGYYQAVIVLAFFLGSVFASRMADRWAGERLLLLGTCLIVTGAVLLVLIILTDSLSPWRLVLPYSIMTFGMGPLFAVAPSRALRSIRGQAGTASALLSGLEQITAGLAAVSISMLHDGTARPMAWVTGALTLGLAILFYLSHQQRASRSIQ
jgi:DHA1 family bicyclomycin/chloramphenicol resistance-like MFS transporter